MYSDTINSTFFLFATLLTGVKYKTHSTYFFTHFASIYIVYLKYGETIFVVNNNNIYIYLLWTANGLIPGGSGTTITHNTQINTHYTNNTQRSKEHTTHNYKTINIFTTHKNTKWVFKLNKKPKVDESVLITIRHTVVNYKASRTDAHSFHQDLHFTPFLQT
jgi:hypothetical protein